MPTLGPRIHFFEVNDQPWFPSFLRSRVQSALTLAWTFRVPFLQQSSPAALVASTLHRVLGGSGNGNGNGSQNVRDYTFVDFCAGAGGPTPAVERILNARLAEEADGTTTSSNNPNYGKGESQSQRRRGDGSGHNHGTQVQFVLTDLHPHLDAWTAAAKKSDNLTFVPESVDAANAPKSSVLLDAAAATNSDNSGGRTKKVFRLFNLAFHHFDDPLAARILHNTLDTADGFGIFELQSRTPSGLATVFLLGPLFTLLTPFYFYSSPVHLFFTYLVPIIPFVLVWDGYISSLRTRRVDEVLALLNLDHSTGDGKGRERALQGWTVRSGEELHTWPVGYLCWVIGVRDGDTGTGTEE